MNVVSPEPHSTSSMQAVDMDTNEHLMAEEEQENEETSCTWREYLTTPDFKELLTCGVFFGLIFIPSSMGPRERPIPFQLLQTGEYVLNQSLNESYEGETVSDTLLVHLAISMPWMLQVLGSFTIGPRRDCHATMCSFLFGMSLNLLATEVLKLYVGYLRPIFYDLCQPDEDFETCTAETSDSKRKSFPSGHASTSFCGLLLFSLYIRKRLGMERWRKDPSAYSVYRARAWSIVSLLPLALALFIASSRIVDNKHFPADVVGGALLGGATAVFAHDLWFH